MTFVCRVTEDLRYRVGTTTDGRDFRPVGPLFTKPREVLTYIAALQAMPVVSPLRSPELRREFPPSSGPAQAR